MQHYDELTTLFTLSSATGSFARSSTTASRPSTPPIQGSTPFISSQRVRTRGVPLQSDSEPATKRIKATPQDEVMELIVSVLKDQQGARRVRFNTVELAVQLLQKEYEMQLSKVHFLVAIDFLTTEAKASVFITLNSSIRDMWLCKNIDVSLM